MTSEKKAQMNRWLIGFAWSVVVVFAATLMAVGSRWDKVGETADSLEATKSELAMVRERVTSLETDLRNICANQQEMKVTLQRMDERQRSEYTALMRAIRDGYSDTPR